jgi:hypothetical protein
MQEEGFYVRTVSNFFVIGTPQKKHLPQSPHACCFSSIVTPDVTAKQASMELIVNLSQDKNQLRLPQTKSSQTLPKRMLSIRMKALSLASRLPCWPWSLSLAQRSFGV